MQTRNVVSRVNVHSLRPIYHRFLNAKTRVMRVEDLRGLPKDALYALESAKRLFPMCDDREIMIHIHRMVPFETTDPKIMNRFAVLCVGRENADGGYVLTKTKTMDLQTGVLGILPNDDATWHVSALAAMSPYEDAYVDVIWFSASS